MSDALFELEDLHPAAAEPSPKGLRELLFAGLVAQLEADAEALHPAFDDAEWRLDAQGRARAGSEYWRNFEQARGIRRAAAAVRAALQTHEEYLLADAERTRRTWTAAELACAQHRDVCPHCTSHAISAWRAARREDWQEKIRATYVQGLHDVIGALADPDRTVTLSHVRKALQKVQDAAGRVWQRSPNPNDTPTVREADDGR